MDALLHLHHIAQTVNNFLYKPMKFPSSFVRMNTINRNIAMNTLSQNNTIDLPNLSAVNFSFSFQFWFSLAFHVPSVVCYVFVLTYILTQKTQRQALHNHSILVLLFIAFFLVLFDYSWEIDTYRRGGQVWPKIPFLCKVWWLFDFGFYSACTIVLAWSSFERHILIFHSNLVATKRKRLLVHYLPLVFIIIYLIIFYIYVIFFVSCENEYDFASAVCGAFPCYLTIGWLAMWDTVVNGMIPTFLIAIFNVALLIRVLWQKQRHRQDWKKCRRMTFQLLSISVLYLSINLPVEIIVTVQLAGYSEWDSQKELYLLFFCSLIQWLLPFVCLTCLPGLWTKIKTCFIRNNRRVIPAKTTQAIGARQQETRV